MFSSCKKRVFFIIFLGFVTVPFLSEGRKVKQSATLKRQVLRLEAKVKKAPQNIAYRLQLGRAYYKMGKWKKAEEHLRKTNEKPTIESLTLFSKVLAKQKKHKEQVRILGLLLDRQPESKFVHTQMGDALSLSKQPERAISHYKTAIRLDSKYKLAHQGLLSVLEGQNNVYEMRFALNQMRRLFPDDAQVLTRLCRLDTESGFFDASMKSCSTAISLDSRQPSNHIYYALTLKYRRQPAQAQRIIFKAADQFPKSELVQFEAGKTQEELKNFEAASKHYVAATRADKKSVRAYLGAGRSFLEIRKFQQSLKFYLTACNLQKSTYAEIRKASGRLRSDLDSPKWYARFREAASNCGL